MNSKLTDFFPWNSDPLERKALLLLDEHIAGSNHTAEFLLTSLLLKFLAHKALRTRVLVLLCNHSASHFEAIMRKNFIDPRQCLASGLLAFVHVHARPEDKPPTELPQRDTHVSWDELHEWEASGMVWPGANVDAGLGCALLVDDLDVLELLAPSITCAKQLVSRIVRQIWTQTTPVNLFAGYGRHPAETRLQLPSMDLQQPDVTWDTTTGSRAPRHETDGTLTEYLRYRANATVVARPLKTGNSSAVHGLVQVLERRGASVSDVLYQYKALDSGISCALARS